MSNKPFFFLSAIAIGALSAFAACGSSAPNTDAAVPGPADAHCASAQAVNAASCQTMGSGGGPIEEEASVLYNAEGDDDDCKYHLSWTATDVAQNEDVTFTVAITTKSDGKPATGADPEPEVFLDATHPAPATSITSTEGEAGTYTIGPIRFDAAGKWTVRFHIHEECTDVAEDSPHGHVAFYVQVP